MDKRIEMVCFKCKIKYKSGDSIAVDVHNEPICLNCNSPLFEVIRNQ